MLVKLGLPDWFFVFWRAVRLPSSPFLVTQRSKLTTFPESFTNCLYALAKRLFYSIFLLVNKFVLSSSLEAIFLVVMFLSILGLYQLCFVFVFNGQFFDVPELLASVALFLLQFFVCGQIDLCFSSAGKPAFTENLSNLLFALVYSSGIFFQALYQTGQVHASSFDGWLLKLRSYPLLLRLRSDIITHDLSAI